MTPLTSSILAITIVSSISLIGAITISLTAKHKGFLKFMLAFAVGALLGDVFIHIIPEMLEQRQLNQATSIFILVGILIFFLLERFLHWHHCNLGAESHPSNTNNKTHGKNQYSLAILNLVGDGVHNIIDGMIITASFLLNTSLGIATTLAVMLHEIPQELSDFSILIHSGLKPSKALVYNLLSALTSFLGMIFILLFKDPTLVTYIALPITAGGFLYIAIADLIPELHKHNQTNDLLTQLLGLTLGILIMYLLTLAG